jgi:hypothetical protein
LNVGVIRILSTIDTNVKLYSRNGRGDVGFGAEKKIII